MSVSTILTSKRTISAIVCSLSLTAMAATPVAVWDGDFSPGELTKFSGYELVDWQMTHGGVSHEGGTATDYSSVTIDRANAGLMCQFGAAKGAFTVLVKYSGLAASTSAKRVVFATTANSDWTYDRCGIRLLTDGTLLGLWNNPNSGNNDADYPSNTAGSGSLPASGMAAYVYSSSSGTFVYSTISGDETISDTAVWSNGSLKAGSMTGIAVGGMWQSANVSGVEAAKGMTIEALAVFDSVLTVAEMNAYIWPSEVQTIPVTDSITVSAINSQIDANTYKTVKIVAEDSVTITVNEAFSTALPIAVSSTGSITLSATSQPDASYFTGVDFSGVQGAVLRSWLATPGVVGFNFNSANGTDTSAALVVGTWQANASDASGTVDIFGDGLSTLTWSSATLYQRSTTSVMLDGYLDDGANGGNGATITLSNVPYETYDVVIYASTDSGSAFTAKTVNGTSYTWDSVQAAVVAGSSSWGSVGVSTAIYGVNALRITDISGPLTICGGARNSSLRGGIAAIQIMPPTAEDIVKTYTLTLVGSATTWSTGAWTLDGVNVSAPTAGNVVINATASTTLTLDADVTLGTVTVNGGTNIVVNLALGEKTAADGDTAATYYSFYAGRVAVESGVLQQGSASVLGSTPVVMVADGATLDLNALSFGSSSALYIAGAGAGDWPWALTSSSGAGGAILGGLYLSADATIGGANELKVGQTQAGYYCYLNGYTLTKVGAGAFTCTNMNTPGTGTIDLQGGAMSVNQWNNLNSASGNTVLTIRDGASFSQNSSSHQVAVQTLNYLGGTLTTSNPLYVKSAFTGSGSTAKLVFSDGVSATLSGDLTVTTAFTLNGSASFAKAQDATGDVTVTPSGTFTTSSSGMIAVGAGVVFNLGTARPAASFTVDDEGTLVVQKSSATDVPVVNVSAKPVNVVFKDENGDEIESPKLVYDSEAGTLTFYAGNVWTATDGTAFDTPANWSSGVAPSSGESATVSISGDTAITVAGTYTLDALVIYGAGEVTFTGAGSVTAANIYLENGATLKRDGATISATTGISLASGTVLKLDSVTESAAISGAGAVETYGNVTMAANNSYTGGTTVKTGTLSSTMPWGYGPFDTSWACTAQALVTVEDGACVSLDNIINVANAYRLVIAGNGVQLQDGTYSGAVVYTGSQISTGGRQISSLTLTADAMVDLGNGWGLVHNGWGAAQLVLNGHTLTMRGSAEVPMVNVDASSTAGTIVLDGAGLKLGHNANTTASNFTGVNIVAKGASTFNFLNTPTAIGSLTIEPTEEGPATCSENWNLPSGFVPALNTSNIDPSGLSVGDTLTLFTAPSGTELTSETISVEAGSRYEVSIGGNTVTATVKALAPFLHYDFNGEASAAGAKASDSTYEISGLGGSWPAASVNGKNGTAALIKNGNTPWWGSLSADVSAIHAGEMSVVALIRPIAIDGTVRTIWNLGQAGGDGMALVAKDASTLALVSWTGGGAGADIVSVSNIQKLAGKWHFVAVVASASGTTLVVDRNEVSTTTCVPQGMTQAGQFGAVHGNGSGKGYYGASDDGFLLDDWRVYDAALTTKEIKALKRELNPDSLFIRLR